MAPKWFLLVFLWIGITHTSTPVEIDIDPSPILPRGVVGGETQTSIDKLQGTQVDIKGEKDNGEKDKDSSGILACFDDTDCDRGYSCSKETYSCEYIQECDFLSGRAHGLKHGDCIPCTTDAECGWQPEMKHPTDNSIMRMDHCWPDGGCRHAPPFRVNTFKIERDRTEEEEGIEERYNSDGDNGIAPKYRVVPSTSFSRGDRMCITVSPALEQQSDWMAIDITKLEMCASKLYFHGKNSREQHNMEKKERPIHPYQRKPDYEYPGILHYDPDNPSSTGCRSDSNLIRRYTVFTKHGDDMVDHTRRDSRGFFSMINDVHHFHPSTEMTTVTKGGDTVCFDAIPITAEDVPIYTEISIRVSPIEGLPEAREGMNASTLENDKLVVEMIYGMRNSNDGEATPWEGVVASKKFKERAPPLAGYYPDDAASDGGSDDDDDGGVFVNCGGGTKFNGVAGLCEAPSVANELFFWTLLGSVIALVAGVILFVLSLNQHRRDLMYLATMGYLDS